jgi:hypothetical protein
MKSERWKTLTKNQQLGAIAAEVKRAEVWENKDKENFISALERGLALIDLTLGDERWREEFSKLFYLRGELAKYYIGKEKNIMRLYAAL